MRIKGVGGFGIILAIVVLALWGWEGVSQEKQCVKDIDCPDSQICEKGQCVQTEKDKPPSGCQSDSDCRSPRKCVNGDCVDPGPNVTPPPAPGESCELQGPLAIDSPAAKMKVQHAIKMQGRIISEQWSPKDNADDAGKRFYRIVVVPHSLMNCHPQSGKVSFKGKTWEASAWIGSPAGSVGDTFDVYVVEVDSKTNDAFDAYIRAAANSGNWQGMSCPGDMIKLQCATVERK